MGQHGRRFQKLSSLFAESCRFFKNANRNWDFGLFRTGIAKKPFPPTAGRKKAENLISDFLLGVPPHAGGYSIVSDDASQQQEVYVKATSIDARKFPAPCNKMLGIIDPLNMLSFSHPNNNAPVPVNINVNV